MISSRCVLPLFTSSTRRLSSVVIGRNLTGVSQVRNYEKLAKFSDICMVQIRTVCANKGLACFFFFKVEQNPWRRSHSHS
jgi:hypothetical protein